MRIVFRNFPQSQTHPLALGAAVAAECAGLQNKFWEMYDALFEHPAALEERHLLSYARRLALDVDKFERSFRNETMLGRIKADFSGGVRSGVDGTPALFINGERYEDVIEEEALVAAIDDHIASRTDRAATVLGGIGGAVHTPPAPDAIR